MKKYIALLSLMPFFAFSCENCIEGLIAKSYEVKEEYEFSTKQTDIMKAYRLGLITGYLDSANTVRINHMEIRMEPILELIRIEDETNELLND